MQRFFVEPHQIDEEAHQIHITGTDVNHIANVLRMKTGRGTVDQRRRQI